MCKEQERRFQQQSARTVPVSIHRAKPLMYMKFFCCLLVLGVGITATALASECDVENREDGCSIPGGSAPYEGTFTKSCKMYACASL